VKSILITRLSGFALNDETYLPKEQIGLFYVRPVGAHSQEKKTFLAGGVKTGIGERRKKNGCILAI